MCGLFGFVGATDIAATLNVPAVLESLRHRGPDDHGSFTETFVGRDGHSQTCLLLHTRLSIVDLTAAGHQPMESRDGRWVLVFNGEIYNHVELRRALEEQGDRFSSRSDTEVVLAALVRWGADALKRFTGMFALALWDRRDASLLLARDRLGEKPLYFAAFDDGTLAFASEVRALMASGAVKREASRRALLSFLETGSVTEPWTIIRGVWAFPPATIACLQNGHVTATRYWTSPFLAESFRSLEAGAPLVRQHLERAVQSQLVADVPVGVFLSAGMDSTAIATIATLARQGSVRSFTVSLDDAAFDEGAIASQIARQLGCEHHDIRISASESLHQVPDAVASLDQPSIDGVNTYIVSGAVRRGGTVVALSGVGGDEIFAGYRAFRAIRRWHHLNRILCATGASRVTRWAAQSMLPLPVRVRKALGLASADRMTGDFHRTFRMLFSCGQIERLLAGALADVEDESCVAPAWITRGASAEYADLEMVNAVSQIELDGYLRNTLLRDTDATSMSHGLEVRAPYLDHDLIAVAASVHGDDKIAGAANKPLLRAAVSEVPPFVSRRPKTGFNLPFDAWLRGALRDWAGASVESMTGLSLPESRRIWQLFQHDSSTVSWSRAWALVVLASWLRRNQVSLN